jgi:hypothetical protein
MAPRIDKITVMIIPIRPTLVVIIRDNGLDVRSIINPKTFASINKPALAAKSGWEISKDSRINPFADGCSMNTSSFLSPIIGRSYCFCYI